MNMTSVQENYLMTRDEWSNHERLCLLSVVSNCRDDWEAVSRSVKSICGSVSRRPSDWFSQKSCAAQYEQILEGSNSPKRIKIEIGGNAPSPSSETITLLLRRITEARIEELKEEIRQEQEEYAKIAEEIQSIQSGKQTGDQLLEMWRSMEKQQEAVRIEEMKLENQMREREQHNQEMQRPWTAGINSIISKSTTEPLGMDVEEIIGTGKVMLFNVGSSHHQPNTQSGTAPLLTTLLKSPNSNSAVVPTVSVSNTTGIGSARATAPTITTLLTSGSIPNSNQPTITLKSSIPPKLLTRPISGPPIELSTPITSAQNLKSPSQSAPTLSMLLEKNKISTSVSTTSSKEARSVEGPLILPKERSIATDSNNEEVPMDIDEEVGANTTTSKTNIPITESDEPDPNEEQQLLEVFKNIGNIDELDIDVAAVIDDEEVDFLKDVGETDSPNATADVMDFEIKPDVEPVETPSQPEILEEKKHNIKKEDTDEIENNSSEVKTIDKIENVIKKEIKAEEEPKAKVETISSDDSNDNIPLATVASLENKDRSQTSDITSEDSFLKEVESANKSEDTDVNAADETTGTDLIEVENSTETNSTPSEAITNSATGMSTNSEEARDVPETEKSPIESEVSDVIVIPTDDESNGDILVSKSGQVEPNSKDHISEVEHNEQENEHLEIVNESVENEIDAESKAEEIPPVESDKIISTNSETNAPPATTISIADTDEDSSTTDISITTRNDDKISSSKLPPTKNLIDVIRSDHKSEDDTIVMSSASTPVPPALRKLRDRDRSESPMIDDETTTTSDHSQHQRSRRRCSSTPVIDSIPNSPASSDRDREDRETRASKKSLMSIFNALQHSKNASAIQRAFCEDYAQKYEEICLRRMDLSMIKKNIESGIIRTVVELQRDLLLMCHNGLMIFKTNSTNYKAAHSFLQECQTMREFISPKSEKDSKESKSSSSSAHNSSIKVRGSARKSLRTS